MCLRVTVARALAIASGVLFATVTAAAEPNRAAAPHDDGGWGDSSEAEGPEPVPEQAPAAEPVPDSAKPAPRILLAPVGPAATGYQQPTPAASEDSVPRAAPASDVAVLGSVGLMSYSRDAGGLLGGVSALYRSGLFGVGAFAELGGLFMSSLSAGGMVGLSVRADRGFRLDVLGTGGVRHYEHWGAEWLGDDPGASATLPFLGVCLRPAYVFSRHRRGHFTLGGMFALDRDLWQRRVSYGYQSSGWLGDGQSYVQEDQVVGGARWALGVVLGATIDVGR